MGGMKPLNICPPVVKIFIGDRISTIQIGETKNARSSEFHLQEKFFHGKNFMPILMPLLLFRTNLVSHLVSGSTNYLVLFSIMHVVHRNEDCHLKLPPSPVFFPMLSHRLVSVLIKANRRKCFFSAVISVWDKVVIKVSCLIRSLWASECPCEPIF